MTATAHPTSRRGAAGTHARGPTGPHPGVLALVSLGLTLGSLATSALLADGRAYLSPFGTTAEILGYYRQHELATRVAAMLLFGSAVPLGILAATAYTRLLRLGVRVPGPSIGFFGGVAASLMLMISAMAGWVLGRPEIGGDPGVLHALSFLSFLTGGVGFVVGLGLLVAGVAVPALVLRLVPRWLAWAGLVIAAVSELTFLAMAITPIQVLLPVGRYAGLLWLITVGFLLPARRPGEQRR
jgi:hypothetical protein